MEHYLKQDYNCSCGKKFSSPREAVLSGGEGERHYLKVGAITKKQVAETKLMNKSLGKALTKAVNQ